MQNKERNNNVCILITAYNEETVIREVITTLISLGHRIIVIDDGSVRLQRDALSGLPVTLLRHPVNLGQGAALRTGIRYALSTGADYLVTFDADGQHLASDIIPLLAPVLSGEADISLGSRFLPGSSHNMPFAKKLILQFARIINVVFTGLWLSDAHNGLRAMSRKAASSISIHSNGMAHATEMLSSIRRKGLQYLEVPVHIRYTRYSRKKGQPISSAFQILFDLILHKLFR